MKWKCCFFLIMFALTYSAPTQVIELKRLQVFAPKAIYLSEASRFRAIYWGWANKVVLEDHFREKIYLIDLSTEEITNEFPLAEGEWINRIDRNTRTITIRSSERIRYLSFENDLDDAKAPQQCTLMYEYHGAPRKKSTFNLARITPDGQIIRGATRFINEIFPPPVENPGYMNVVDCLNGGDFILLTDEMVSSADVYYAQLDDLELLSIKRLGLFGAQAFFVDDKTIISFKYNEEIEHRYEDEPFIFYPVLVTTDGDIIFEDRSIRLVEAMRVFDYDPVTKRVVAFVLGPTRTSSKIAVFQLYDEKTEEKPSQPIVAEPEKKPEVVAKPPKAEPEWWPPGYVSDDNVRLRTAPNLEGAIIRLLKNGEKVKVLEMDPVPMVIGEHKANWYKVETETGEVGWMYGQYLRWTPYPLPIEEEKKPKAEPLRVGN